MKQAITTVTGIIAIGATLLGTLAHGRLTNRWNGADEKRAAAGEALARAPKEFGNWRMQSESPFEARIQGILDFAGAINRTYVNAETGQVVSLAMIIGPSGPTVSHTAELCYSSQGYKLMEDTAVVDVEVDGKTNAFRRTLLQSKSIASQRLEVLYGWRYGDAWEAPQAPRLTFGGKPFLFKLQMAANYDVEDKNQDTMQVTKDFLRDFLPALDKQVFSQVEFN
jgi:hypothetical protein